MRIKLYIDETQENESLKGGIEKLTTDQIPLHAPIIIGNWRGYLRQDNRGFFFEANSKADADAILKRSGIVPKMVLLIDDAPKESRLKHGEYYIQGAQAIVDSVPHFPNGLTPFWRHRVEVEGTLEQVYLLYLSIMRGSIIPSSEWVTKLTT